MGNEVRPGQKYKIYKKKKNTNLYENVRQKPRPQEQIQNKTGTQTCKIRATKKLRPHHDRVLALVSAPDIKIKLLKTK